MPNLNQVNLMGNLTRDPEIKYTPKGTAVAQIGLAINRHWKNDAGVKQEETTFVDVELWGRTAEVVGEYFKKGAPIFITGRLKQESWTDKETGKPRSKMKVIAEGFEFLGTQRTERPEADAAAGRKPSAPARPPADPDLDPAKQDGIPF